MRIAKHLLVVLVCCLPLALTGCIAYGPCGPVYVWDFFGSGSAESTTPSNTNEEVSTSSSQSDSDRVTPEFLVDRGFIQGKSDTNLYTLGQVTLEEAARRLGFSTSQMRPTPSQSIDSDIRIVKVRNLLFVIRSEMRDSRGRVISGSLDNPDALCSVSVSLAQVSNGKLIPKIP